MAFFRKAPSRKLALHLADLHCGHRLGLMPPDVTLWDVDELGNYFPYRPVQTGVQQYLYGKFEGWLDDVGKLAGGIPVVVFVDGDLTHGTKHAQGLVSAKVADHLTIAVGCIERILEIPNVAALRLISGTGWHEFHEGTSAVLAARELQAGYPEVDVACVHHSLFDVDGFTMDVAHHGPSVGIRNWLRGNVLRLYTLSLIRDCLDMGQEPPGAVIRGHRHRYAHETVRKIMPFSEYVTEAFVLPSFSGLSHHGRKVSQSRHLLGCGMLALVVEDGKLVDTVPLRHTVDLRTKEVL